MSIEDATSHRVDETAAGAARAPEESPENLPPKAWVTLVVFAGFVVAASGCAVGQLFW